MFQNQKQLKWNLQKKKLSDLVEFEKNPRKLTKKQFKSLKESIEKFGLIDKPIINLDNTIIGGHQRIRTLAALGETEIECWVADHPLSPKDLEELNIRLNKCSGEWDWDKLANEFETNLLTDWGFDTKELAKELEGSLPELEEEEEEPQNCPTCGKKMKS